MVPTKRPFCGTLRATQSMAQLPSMPLMVLWCERCPVHIACRFASMCQYVIFVKLDHDTSRQEMCDSLYITVSIGVDMVMFLIQLEPRPLHCIYYAVYAYVHVNVWSHCMRDSGTSVSKFKGALPSAHLCNRYPLHV